MSETQEKPARRSRSSWGRPRDANIDERVLTATRASLVDLGWDRTSIRGVAERSGVSRPAIARRWPSKTHLVLDAILGAEPDLDIFDGVNLDGWIAGVIDSSFELFDRPAVRAAAPGLLATLRDHIDVRDALWEGFSGPASELALHLQSSDTQPESELLMDAQAAITVAAGAALFMSLIVGDNEQLRDRVTAALTDSMTEILDPKNVEGQQ